MFLGLCGGLCAGKNSVAQYLVEHYGFMRVYLRLPAKKYSTRNGEHGSLSADAATPKNRNFATVDDLLEYITKRWQQRWVTTDVWDTTILESLSRRPFFLLVSVDAPISMRFKRYTARCKFHDVEPPSLEDFVTKNDDHLYHPQSGIAVLVDRAEVRLVNAASSLDELHEVLEKLDLTNEQRLRPSWDQYFMQLASLAAQRSNCMKRRVGCVLVREKRVISTGYNGTPRNLKNCNQGGCSRCNEALTSGIGLATCLCIHAEENALLEAGRERIREETVLYCDTCPCLTCSIKITQVGISEVVYAQGYSMDQETAAIFQEAGVTLRQFSPPRKGLIPI